MGTCRFGRGFQASGVPVRTGPRRFAVPGVVVLLAAALLAGMSAQPAGGQSDTPAQPGAVRQQDQTRQGQATQDQTTQDQDQDDPDAPPVKGPPEPATAVPSPPAQGSVKTAGKPMAPAPDASPEAAAAPAPTVIPRDADQKAIAGTSADLLNLAHMLKAEMDKTTADQLSVSVIRKAAQIEQLAHRMRTQ